MGSGIWVCVLLTWIVVVFNGAVSPDSDSYALLLRLLQGAGLGAVLLVVFFTLRYWRYKWVLRREPAIRSALGDERVTLAWLKAYRFAFFAVVALHLGLLLTQSVAPVAFGFGGIRLPQFAEIPLTLLLALVACTGSFLYYGREV
jgi:prepilin signal peptidase PulO-like enzyme (type II secretory pathway)